MNSRSGRRASGEYDDIINLPAYELRHHAPMSTASRAAQFLPFDALDGYSGAVAETAQETDARPELSTDELAALDAELSKIAAALSGAVVHSGPDHDDHAAGDPARECHAPDGPALPEVEAAYFVPDEVKAGGRVEYFAGRVKAIDDTSRALIFEDGTVINADDVIALRMIG